MAYVDQTLVPGERVVHRALRHWLFLVRPAAVFLVCLIGGIVFASHDVMVLAWPLFVVPAIYLLLAYLEYVSSQFALTNRRVVVNHGIVRRRSQELLLAKVETINVEQGLMGRLLGYGTLRLTGTGAAFESFPMISKPLALRAAVQQQIEEAQRPR